MISLPVTQPFPWDQLLSYLSTRCIPSFEYIDNQCFNRLHNGKNIIVSFNRDAKQLEININPNTKNSKEIYRRVEQLFYPALSTDIIYKHLSIALPESKMMKGFRPLGCWDPFELCIRTIIGQQVSVAAAQTIMHRLIDRCEILTPQSILDANLEKMGMPERRVQTLRDLGQAVIDTKIDFTWPWSRLDNALSEISGIGPWTRGYLAIRLGRDPDAFPETDVGLIRAAGADDAKNLLDIAKRWQPYRAYAATCLWSLD